MQTVKEMLADVRADRDRRQQLEQEQEQKRLDIQKALSMAEQEMKEALARHDQEAYHAAEGRVPWSYLPAWAPEWAIDERKVKSQ